MYAKVVLFSTSPYGIFVNISKILHILAQFVLKEHI